VEGSPPRAAPVAKPAVDDSLENIHPSRRGLMGGGRGGRARASDYM
jgi:hypothetical protein